MRRKAARSDEHGKWRAGRRATAALALAWTLAIPVAVGAQGAATPEKKIVAITFEGLRAIPEDTLKYYLGVHEGRPLDEAALDRAIHALWQRKLIDDLKVSSEPVEGGVKLHVTVVERATLKSITYDGMKRVSHTDLSEKIAKEQIEVREGNAVSMGELARLKTTIEEMYRDKGYRFAEAKFRLVEGAPGERRVVFTVDEGDRVRIQKLRFPGAKVFARWRMRLAMKKTKESGLISRILRHDIYNPATLQEDLDNLRKLYKASGYKDVALGEPQIEVRALNPKARNPRDQKRRLWVTIPIEEGQRWRLGEISIDGNKVFPDTFLLKQFKRPRGGWLAAKLIDDTVKDIGDTYRNFGYIYSEVDTEIKEKPKNVADLLVHIKEGEQWRVGRMEFTGNTNTRDKVLRREFRVQEGTVLNMGAVKNSLYKINQLQYFKLNEDDPVQFKDFDSEKKTVDLSIKGEEADRTELQVGGGWSEVDGFFGQISVKTQNFLGRGESVGIGFQKGRYRTEETINYSIPWFLDKPQSLGIELFNSNLDYSYSLAAGETYIQKSEGAVLSYGRNFGLFSSYSISFNRSRGNNTRSLYDTNGNLVTEAVEVYNSSIRPGYLYESRDSRAEPTRGKHFHFSLEIAGGVLGGSNYFLRPESGFSIFQPVFIGRAKQVAAFNVESGWIQPYGGHPLTYLQTYFLGGETSVRGFKYRSIWVRDKRHKTVYDASGFPLGGNKFLQLNGEYHFLLGGPFRLIFFADAGAVFADSQSYDPNLLRTSAGVEIRIFVPVFGAPLRFIYSRNLHPLPDDEFESFQFSIGATF